MTQTDPTTNAPASAPTPMHGDLPIDDTTWEMPLPDSEAFLNREVSWLEFNRRVLHEALDDRTPLLERIGFLAIFSSNLDEYYQKRVGYLKRQIDSGEGGWRITTTLMS